MTLCGKCGAYWACDCEQQGIGVDEIGVVSEEMWAYLKQRAESQRLALRQTVEELTPRPNR